MGRSESRTNRLRRRPVAGLEALEKRELLASGTPLDLYHVLPIPPRIGPGRASTRPILKHPVQTTPPRVLDTLDNQGKIVTGKNRAGNEYVIGVHGPGRVIVTDVTPNDGALDDDLDTIQIIGSDPRRTKVIGQVIASARTVTDGTIEFQRLISENGVKSIKLNGFTLTQTIAPPPGVPNYANVGIFLPKGVGLLQFHDIDATFDLAASNVPVRVVIGDPANPLTVEPIIRVDNIFNTVIDSALDTIPNGVPQTTPSVIFEINGTIRHIDFLSSGPQPVVAGQQANFPTVSITGRTAVRAEAIRHLQVTGSAKNTTFARGQAPATRPFLGLRRLGQALFGGNADAVGIYVDGSVDHVSFQQGLGNPTGSNPSPTALGTPTADFGYPAFGLLGGTVAAEEIGAVLVGPANQIQQLSQDPDFRQVERTNVTTYFARPGNALTSASITTSGSIGSVKIVGNSQNSEIKTGFDYPSYVAGLEPTRSPSAIRRFGQRGDLIDSVNSASYRPNDNIYGNGNDTAGRGTIRGNLTGRTYLNGHRTALNNLGVGNYARTKIGNLPPPLRPRRVQGERVV